ncbi:MAG: hypothetical protein KF787_00310 [Phycisphaeraceae bacterium]|nr:hypothetical protein [Phycisphaerae bacterium]MBX3391066.1 hypothetical protein [Phycisphaeraceae bacterium]
MGTWTLQNVTGTTSNHDTGELFGTNVEVEFTLVYRPASVGFFAETPHLDWHERFVMKEHHKGEWWEFESNMYTHNPCSNTLLVWPKRYTEAYLSATGQPKSAMLKGGVVMKTINGQPMPPNAIPAGIADQAAQADAVRSYLKKSGGMLIITIHDIPSITRPPQGEHYERMLEFDCGIVSGGPRFRGVQLLDLDGSAPPATWFRNFMHSAPGPLQTAGLRKVPAPVGVSNPRTPVFSSGEYM